MPQAKCPICKKPSKWDETNPHRPFCSERCKMIDLGYWVMEKYRIEGESAKPEKKENKDDDVD